MTPSGISLIVLLLFLLISVVIYTLLIMVIWNNVLVPKVKGADLQKLNFWNALAIGIFFSLVTGGTTVIQKS
jgi:hypothetical protein